MNREMRVLLLAEAVSALGSQVTVVALPLTALLLLRATPLQMGLLSGAAALPGVLFGLIFGLAIDRLPKRGLLLAASAASALAMAMVPLGHAGGWLSIGVLIGVNFAAAGIANAKGIALMSLIPSVVPPAALARANGNFIAVISAARIGGPALAGGLVAAFSAPGAITVDALSFAIAGLFMLALPRVAVPPASAEGSVLAKLRGGFGFISADSTMRLFVMIAAGTNLFGAGFQALSALFVVRHLGVKPAWYGVALAVGGGGAVVGGLLAPRLAGRINLNVMLAVAIGLAMVSDGGVCLLRGPPDFAAVCFAVASFIDGVGSAVLTVAFSTYLQEAAPPAILARVTGVLVTLIGASVPVGALAAGVLGGAIGVRHTLMLVTGGLAAVLGCVLARGRGGLRAAG